jgi:hypothetical protein
MFRSPRNVLTAVTAIVATSALFAVSTLLLAIFPSIRLDLNRISALGSYSQAISTLFALVLGLIAVIVAVRVESADHAATEEVKTKTLELLSVLYNEHQRTRLHGFRNQQFSRNEPYAVDVQTARVVSSFMASTSHFAYLCYAADKSREAKGKGEEWRTYWLHIDDLRYAGSIGVVHNATRALLAMLSNLTRDDFRAVAKHLVDLEDATDHFKEFIAEDVLARSGSLASEPEEVDTTEDDFRAIRAYLKVRGQSDPDVDCFVAVFDNDVDLLKDALERGANPAASSGEVLSRHSEALKAIRGERDSDKDGKKKT